jgi:hypothetical protein
MKYILIANNNNILDEEIDKLEINSEDIIILFNHQFPLRWKKIRDHPNKLLIIRMMSWGFLGARQAKDNQHLYKKIIPYPKNNYPVSVIKQFIQRKIGSNILKKLEFISDTMHKLLHDVLKYPSNKDPTLGYIGYNYIKHMIGENIDIVLVGFTLVYNGRLGSGGSGHAWDFEVNFYKNELKNNNRLIKIDAVYEKHLTPTFFTPIEEPPKITKNSKLKKKLRPVITGHSLDTEPSKLPPKKQINLNIKPQVKNLLKLHFQRTRFLGK